MNEEQLKAVDCGYITREIFCQIFKYGNENSGNLMFDRLQNQFKNDLAKFYKDMCEIDRGKFDDFFLTEI